VVELREALDRLGADFSKQLAEQVADKEETEKRVQTLESEIELLKEALQTTTKRQWTLMLCMKLQKWCEKLSIRQIRAGAKEFRVKPALN